MSSRYYAGPKTDHYDGKRFFNPGLPSNDKTLVDLFRWKIFGKRPVWPKFVKQAGKARPEQRCTSLTITSIGHSSLLVQVDQCNILIDPVWASRASPFQSFGPRRVTEPGITFADLPPIDAVLLTHNHYDHCDLTSIVQIWESHRPLIFTPLGNDLLIRSACPNAKVRGGDWWESVRLNDGVTVTIVPAHHWSSRTIFDRRKALWGGFFVRSPSASIYFAGDTAFGTGQLFADIREQLGTPEVAIVPIGAYAPRWFMASQHVTPEEAIEIAVLCGARQVLGVHWGTFPLTDEPFDEPQKRFLTAARAAGFRSNQTVAMHSGTVWSDQ